MRSELKNELNEAASYAGFALSIPMGLKHGIEILEDLHIVNSTNSLSRFITSKGVTKAMPLMGMAGCALSIWQTYSAIDSLFISNTSTNRLQDQMILASSAWNLMSLGVLTFVPGGKGLGLAFNLGSVALDALGIGILAYQGADWKTVASQAAMTLVFNLGREQRAQFFGKKNLLAANNNNHFDHTDKAQPHEQAIPLAAGGEDIGDLSLPAHWVTQRDNVIHFPGHTIYNASFDPAQFRPEHIGTHRTALETRLTTFAQARAGAHGKRAGRGGEVKVLIGILDRAYPANLKVHEALVLEQAALQENASRARAVLEQGRDRGRYIVEAAQLTERETRDLYGQLCDNLFRLLGPDDDMAGHVETLRTMGHLLADTHREGLVNRVTIDFYDSVQTFEAHAADPIYRTEALAGLLHLAALADPTATLRQKPMREIPDATFRRINQNFLRRRGGEDAFIATAPAFCERLTFLREHCELIQSAVEATELGLDTADLMRNIGISHVRSRDTLPSPSPDLHIDNRTTEHVVGRIKEWFTKGPYASESIEERSLILDRLAATHRANPEAVRDAVRRVNTAIPFVGMDMLNREAASLFENTLREHGELDPRILAEREVELMRDVLRLIGPEHALLPRLSAALRSITDCAYLPDAIRTLHYITSNPRRLEAELARQREAWPILGAARTSGQLPHEPTLLVPERPGVARVIGEFLERAVAAREEREQAERDAAMLLEHLDEAVVVTPRPIEETFEIFEEPPAPVVEKTFADQLKAARAAEQTLLETLSDTSGETRLARLRTNLTARTIGFEEAFGEAHEITVLATQIVSAAERLLQRHPVDRRIDIAQRVFNTMNYRESRTATDLIDRLHTAHDIVDAAAIERAPAAEARDILAGQWERSRRILDTLGWNQLGIFVDGLLPAIRSLPADTGVTWLKAHSLPQIVHDFRQLSSRQPALGTAITDWIARRDLGRTDLDHAGRRLDAITSHIRNIREYLETENGRKIFGVTPEQAALIVKHTVQSKLVTDTHLHYLFKRYSTLEADDLREQFREHPREAKIGTYLDSHLNPRNLTALAEVQRLFAMQTPEGLLGNSAIVRLPQDRFNTLINGTLSAISRLAAIARGPQETARAAAYRILRDYLDPFYTSQVVDSQGNVHQKDRLVWPRSPDPAACMGAHSEFQALVGVLDRSNAWTRLLNFTATADFEPDWVLSATAGAPASIGEAKSSYRREPLSTGADVAGIFYQAPKYLQHRDLAAATVDYYLLWHRLSGRPSVSPEEIITRDGVLALVDLIADNGTRAPLFGTQLDQALNRVRIHLADYQDPSRIILIGDRPFVSVAELKHSFSS